VATLKELADKKRAQRSQESREMEMHKRIRQEKEGAAELSPMEQAKMNIRHRKERAATIKKDTIDPTEGMGNFEKTMAGMGRGMTDVVQNIGNVLGIVEDETITDRRELDQPLMDTTAGKVGSVLGETMALAPLGFTGKGAQLLHKGLKGSRFLAPIAKTLAHPISVGATEGAMAGGIMGGPEKRGTGAMMGAAAGGALTGVGQALGRTFKDGLVKNIKEGDELLDVIKNTTGKKSFIPTGISASSGGGPTSTITKAIESDVLGFLPSAKGQFQSQTAQLTDDIYETFIRKAFTGIRGKGIDDIVKVFRETGDVLKALERAKALGHPMSTPAQKALWKAANNNTIGKGRFLHGEAEKGLNVGIMRSAVNDVEKEIGGKILKGSYKELVDTAGEVLQRTGSGSSPYVRNLFYEGQGAATDAIGGVANFVTGGAAHVLASKPFQNWLMGRNVPQKMVQEAMKKPSGKIAMELLGAFRREMSATGSEPNIQMREQASALRDNIGGL